MKSKYYLGDRDAAYEIDPTQVIKFHDLCEELGTKGIQELLTHLFFQWPTIPQQPTEIHRYGGKRKTWPIHPEQVKEAITCGGKYDDKVAYSVLLELFENSGCECKQEQSIVVWPDVQQIFTDELGEAKSKEVKMISGDPPADPIIPNLTLKIPEEHIKPMLIGEWRMYCKSTGNGGKDPAFSYGLIIDDVTEVEHTGHCKKYEFKARPRQAGKYDVKNGTCVWNEAGSGRLFMEYVEVWPNGTEDHLKARLKSNGKFQCNSEAGFIQKARKEDTLPTSHKLRLESKYYAGDTDAAED